MPSFGSFVLRRLAVAIAVAALLSDFAQCRKDSIRSSHVVDNDNATGGGSGSRGRKKSRSAPSRRLSERPHDGEAVKARKRSLHGWLFGSRQRNLGGAAAVVDVNVPAADPSERAEIERPAGRGEPKKVGVVRRIGRSVDLCAGGEVREDGVRTVHVNSPGALGLGVRFEDTHLNAKSNMYVYGNREDDAQGPFPPEDVGPKGRGEFASRMVAGEDLFIQVHDEGACDGNRLIIAEIRVLVSPPDLDHGRDLLAEEEIAPWRRLQGEGQCQTCTTGSCPDLAVNAGTPSDVCCGGGEVADYRYAAAHYTFVSGAWVYMCSGGLVNGGGTPYFLTANHCMKSTNEASSAEFFFQYWADCTYNQHCINGQVYPPASPESVLGGSVLATGVQGDFTLLEFNDPLSLPSDSVLLGWTSEEVAFSHGSKLYRIFHTGAHPQGYSEVTVNVNYGTCAGWPRGRWIYGPETVGCTGGGASGSPIINGQNQIVGQLSGGCDSHAVDGALASYFGKVSQWLDPGSGPNPTTSSPTMAPAPQPVCEPTDEGNLCSGNCKECSCGHVNNGGGDKRCI